MWGYVTTRHDYSNENKCLDRIFGGAEGDLTARVEQALMPSLDQLRIDFDAAAEALHAALAQVSEGASAIHAAVDDIARASDDLSRRTEHQAASLEETAAALNEITATVKRSA